MTQTNTTQNKERADFLSLFTKIVNQVAMKAWEQGKKQKEQPYEFTLSVGSIAGRGALDLWKMVDKSLSQAHQSGIEEGAEAERKRIVEYQNGFVQDDGAGEGNYLFAPEFGVIDDLLKHLESLKENK